jgi:hypothetical protein
LELRELSASESSASGVLQVQVAGPCPPNRLQMMGTCLLQRERCTLQVTSSSKD